MAGLARKPDRTWIRPAYRPEDYTITAAALANLHLCPYGTVEELAKYDGLYGNYDALAESVHDGKRYARLAERSKGWIIEVELTADPPAEVRLVPPEEAWARARTRDALSPTYIPIEGEPPVGFTDPNPRRG